MRVLAGFHNREAGNRASQSTADIAGPQRDARETYRPALHDLLAAALALGGFVAWAVVMYAVGG